ncbi:hypothetical protein [Runella salmonicolor]|uniref:Uncharacterized protein n=1 Tax=Runella salmonicolor TaxID=2950278 RepID=A0ABT1FVU2_9BACT|nr:hypothetical protein [Runella salmonicolor]MCP1384783.1 hypothetical protein [Runella salmonicolor]
MNNVINKIALLSEMAHASLDLPTIDVGVMVVNIEKNKFSYFVDKLTEFDCKFIKLGSNKIEIDLDFLIDENGVFVDLNDFYQNVNLSPDILRKNFYILIYLDSFFGYNQGVGTSYLGEIEVFDNYLQTNTLAYINLRNRLKKEDFADYENFASEEIIFYTGTKGVLKLRIPSIPIFLDTSIDYSKYVNEIIDKMNSKDFTIHFKNVLFSLEKKSANSQIEVFYLNISSLLQEANNNYELQLKNFSFEKFKNDLLKEKEKYFASLREILGKILTQILGVPISIAASTFASYKIDNIYILYLVLLSFLIYIIFAIYFQTIYYSDVLEVEKAFNKDFAKIASDSGLPELEVNSSRDSIKRRIKVIKNSIIIFIASVVTLGLLFVFYMMFQIKQGDFSPKNDKVPRHFTSLLKK